MAASPSQPRKDSSQNVNQEAYRKAAATTLASIQQVASPAELTYFSNRSLAEVEALQEEVSAVIPAGNIVGLVLGGLIRLRGRTLPEEQARSDVSALLRGLEMLPRHILPSTLYGTFFVGPAAVLAAYQKLLALAGKDLDSAFPEGLWQFYLEFALREDSARHTNETLGFQQGLLDYGLHLSAADQLAAWVCAISQIYFQYDDLLHNEWHERVCLYLLEQAVAPTELGRKLQFQRLPQAWAVQRPYHRGKDATHDENYPLYRRRRFENFWRSRLDSLPAKYQKELEQAYTARLDQLADYQRQMTVLAAMEPERYRENRKPVPLWQARIGVIFEGRYYLLPACHLDQAGRPLLFESPAPGARSYPLEPGPAGALLDRHGQPVRVARTGQVYQAGTNELLGILTPIHFQTVRRLSAAIFADRPAAPAELDEQLLLIRRSEQERARKELKGEAAWKALETLRYAPFILNWDEQDGSRPLAYIRQSKRGIGDNALTVFRTSQSMVFDMSHVFFDGPWGMALAEILTGEAISWAAYFNSLPAPEPANVVPYQLRLPASNRLGKFPILANVEVAAENTGIKTSPLYELCKVLSKRHPDLKLTVNDLLILFRGQFGREYQNSQEVADALFELKAENTPEAQDAYDLVNNILVEFQASNPALMIPMDATAINPRERLYPTTFRNPFTELWATYQSASSTLNRYQQSPSAADWAAFTDARRSFLSQLHYFGQLLRSYKRVALEGGSTSTATIKLMAHLPDSLFKLLDEIPRRIDILNEVIKGEEVFSNVGRVARGSSLNRFISAKDDNENKALVWGVLTNDKDILHLSLRDFRPHVAVLDRLNQRRLAELIAEDYLESFVTGFNEFVTNALDIVNATATHTH